MTIKNKIIQVQLNMGFGQEYLNKFIVYSSNVDYYVTLASDERVIEQDEERDRVSVNNIKVIYTIE